MNEHERELLELVREKKERLTPDVFRSWLRGFRLVGRESEELATELDKFIRTPSVPDRRQLEEK